MEGGVGECHVPGQTPVGQCQTRANIAQRDARQWGAAAAPHKACGTRTLSTPAPAASDLARDADEEQKAGEDGLRKAADAGESGRACNTSLEHCALPPAGAECSQCQTCRPARRMLRRDRPPTRRAVERRPTRLGRRTSRQCEHLEDSADCARAIATGLDADTARHAAPSLLRRPRGACPERACVRDRGRGGGAEARGRCDARARRAPVAPRRALALRGQGAPVGRAHDAPACARAADSRGLDTRAGRARRAGKSVVEQWESAQRGDARLGRASSGCFLRENGRDGSGARSVRRDRGLQPSPGCPGWFASIPPGPGAHELDHGHVGPPPRAARAAGGGGHGQGSSCCGASHSVCRRRGAGFCVAHGAACACVPRSGLRARPPRSRGSGSARAPRLPARPTARRRCHRKRRAAWSLVPALPLSGGARRTEPRSCCPRGGQRGTRRRGGRWRRAAGTGSRTAAAVPGACARALCRC